RAGPGSQPRRASAHRGGLPDDRRDRGRAAAVASRAGPLRYAPASLPGLGQRPLRHRSADRGDRLVGVGRLPTLLSFHAGGSPCRPGPNGGSVRPAPSRRQAVPSGATDTALGAVGSSQGLITPGRPRPRLLRQGQGRSQRQGGCLVDRTQAGTPLLPHSPQPRPRSGLRHALAVSPPSTSRGPDRLNGPSGFRGRQLQLTRSPPAGFLPHGPKTKSPPPSPLPGVTQSKMSSPTTPSSSSTQVTLGDPRPSIVWTNRPLTTRLHTGNARWAGGRRTRNLGDLDGHVHPSTHKESAICSERSSTERRQRTRAPSAGPTGVSPKGRLGCQHRTATSLFALA